jgi:hypothetical protein
VLDVINASTHAGLAARLEPAFAARGFTAGTTSTADTLAAISTIDYGPGVHDAAQTLADQLDLPANPSDAVTPGTVQLMIGTDFPAGQFTAADTAQAATNPPATDPATPTTPVTTVPATAAGTSAPLPTDLTHMTAAAIPCVK